MKKILTYMTLCLALAVSCNKAELDQNTGTGVLCMDMKLSEQRYVRSLEGQKAEKKEFPDLSHAALADHFPGRNQSLTQVLGTADARVNDLAE